MEWFETERSDTLSLFIGCAERFVAGVFVSV